MAAKTPTAQGTAGHVKQGVYGVGSTAQTITNNLLTDVANHYPNRNGFRLSVFHFADIDDTDTWTSEIKNAVACAWQPEDATDDAVRAVITTTAGGSRSRSGAVFTFVSVNANSAGWLWVLHGS